MIFRAKQNGWIELQLGVDTSVPYKEQFHFHPGVEIFYIHDGVGQVIIDHQLYEVTAHSLIFYRPYQPHYQQMVAGPGHPNVRSMFRYDERYVSQLLKPFPKLYAFHHKLCHGEDVVQVQQMPAYIGSLIEQFHERYAQHPVKDPVERNAVFLLAFFQWIEPLWDSLLPASQDIRIPDPFVATILGWIDEHYQEPFDLKQLAQHVHMTPNYISHLFHKQVGKTITDFVTIRRMKQASILLQTTSMDIRDIGIQCGYPNFSYFCKRFKKQMGMSPNQFRIKTSYDASP